MLQLNNFLWSNYGYGVVSGTCGDVGVSGLAMGGGFGYLTRKYGFLVDQIVSAEIVTANGKQLSVNEKQNKDLFWAIRGAGAAGFGVVTQFTLKAFPATETFVWARLKYSLNDLSLLLNLWQQIMKFRNCSTVGLHIERDNFPYGVDYIGINFVIVEQEEDNKQLETLQYFLPNIT
ncbi:lipoprotein-like protein, partial [Leptotrombidium deliense]